MIPILNKFSKPIIMGLLFGLMVIINSATVYACEWCTITASIENTLVCEDIIEEDIEIEAVIDEEEIIITEDSYTDDIIIIEEAVIEEDTSEASYFRTTANLRLRTGPSLYHEIIRTVPSGSTIRVYDQRDGMWFSVYQAGSRGYMYAEFLTPISQDASTSAYNPQIPSVNANGVELVEWWTARNNIFRTGVPLHITDVRTGITFWLQSFSHGNHADVIPRYREDTEALRNAFGGRWSWEPRPIWVTVDGRTFAASMSGMPHGSFNSRDNGVVGHFCVHFQGSRTHNGNRSHERDHQNAVQEAFRAQR